MVEMVSVITGRQKPKVVSECELNQRDPRS